jgi:hypothetical protein
VRWPAVDCIAGLDLFERLLDLFSVTTVLENSAPRRTQTKQLAFEDGQALLVIRQVDINADPLDIVCRPCRVRTAANRRR